jgi:hypothetical protein
MSRTLGIPYSESFADDWRASWRVGHKYATRSPAILADQATDQRLACAGWQLDGDIGIIWMISVKSA